MNKKRLFLVRGVPGSGKTTLADIIGGYQISADDFMINERGDYSFSTDKLNTCHALCLNAVESAMTLKVGKICVHNTFTRNWEMEPYKVIAERYGYEVFVVRCENDFGNTHDVPDSKVKSMLDRFEDNEG